VSNESSCVGSGQQNGVMSNMSCLKVAYEEIRFKKAWKTLNKEIYTDKLGQEAGNTIRRWRSDAVQTV